MNNNYNKNYNISQKPSVNNNINEDNGFTKFNADEHINTFMNKMKNK